MSKLMPELSSSAAVPTDLSAALPAAFLQNGIDPDAPCALLGGMSVTHFLAEYWHKKPLLIRQAIPQFSPLIDKKALLDFATWEDVESRLIERKRNERKEVRWQMQHGPLTAKQIPSVK